MSVRICFDIIPFTKEKIHVSEHWCCLVVVFIWGGRG